MEQVGTILESGKDRQIKVLEEARRTERVEGLQASMNEFCVTVRPSPRPSLPCCAMCSPSLPPSLPPSPPPSPQGDWRKKAYAPREYVPISNYVPGADGMSEGEVEEYLETHLDGFLGQPYNYDDQELSEQWMRTLASEDSLQGTKRQNKELIEAQVCSPVPPSLPPLPPSLPRTQASEDSLQGAKRQNKELIEAQVCSALPPSLPPCLP